MRGKLSSEKETDERFSQAIDLVKKTNKSVKQISDEVSNVVLGKEETIEMVMAGILANGNILFEDFPGLAKTLMSPAKIFLLDEPCAALDPPAKEDFLKIVRQLADAGLSLMVSSHDWGTSLNSYDQVIVLDKAVLACGSPDSIKDKLEDINISSIEDNNCCD